MAKIKSNLPKKKHMILKVLGIILAVIVVIVTCVYCFVLQYPEIKNAPKVDRWYRVSSDMMKSSDGSEYHAFFKKGTENKVMVYFAGGGVSINEQTAKNDTYNTKLLSPDILANTTMNMGGIASDIEGSPYKNWTIILFPYATGDFHCGAGEFKYIDKDGKEKILYHNGYNNFTATMDKVMEYAEIDNSDTVVVTGYSAGGFGASLLADDVFSNYFPTAKSKTVLVDASLLLFEQWNNVAKNVWQAPEHIASRLTSENITLDNLTALHNKWGNDVTILFDSSTRDGDLAKVQRYLKDGVMNEDTGEMPLEEKDADEYFRILTETVPKFKEQAGAYLFIWDGLPWYDDPRDFTMHTIIAVPYSFAELSGTGSSVSEWLMDAVNGNPKDYGLELVNSKTE